MEGITQITPSNFTNDQTNCTNFLIDFVNSPDTECIIYGAAGTGKTYLLDFFLNNVYTKKSAVSAFTHKAVRVIESRVKKKGLTIHSLHGLALNTDIYNFDLNNLQFDPKNEPKLPEYTLIAIDECSQVNTGLYDLTFDRASRNNVKIIYIGDRCQLAPIGERESRTFSIKRSFELTEVVRQKGDNPLLDVLILLREDIKVDGNKAIWHLYKNQKVLNDKREGHVILNPTQFVPFMYSKFKENPLGNKFIAYTNECIRENNYEIRTSLTDSKSDILVKGDVLVAYKTIVDEFLVPIITNSEEYTIKSIEYGRNNYDLDVYYVSLVNEFTPNGTSILQIIDHRSSTFDNFFELLKYKYAQYVTAPYNRKKTYLNEYFDFKKIHLTMIDLNAVIGDKKLYAPKEISYAYGLTCHKAQGSTYDNVFMDIKNITHYSDGVYPIKNTKWAPYAVETRNKLLYTALSRASKTAYIKL